jgi:hypothetical protein
MKLSSNALAYQSNAVKAAREYLRERPELWSRLRRAARAVGFLTPSARSPLDVTSRDVRPGLRRWFREVAINLPCVAFNKGKTWHLPWWVWDVVRLERPDSCEGAADPWGSVVERHVLSRDFVRVADLYRAVDGPADRPDHRSQARLSELLGWSFGFERETIARGKHTRLRVWRRVRVAA